MAACSAMGASCTAVCWGLRILPGLQRPGANDHEFEKRRQKPGGGACLPAAWFGASCAAVYDGAGAFCIVGGASAQLSVLGLLVPPSVPCAGLVRFAASCAPRAEVCCASCETVLHGGGSRRRSQTCRQAVSVLHPALRGTTGGTVDRASWLVVICWCGACAPLCVFVDRSLSVFVVHVCVVCVSVVVCWA